MGDLKVSRKYEVPYLAGYSKDGKCIYIDKRLSRTLKLKSGRIVKTDKYLAVHEATEKHLEDTKGYKYQYAHEEATGAERKAVEADGIPWDEYQNFMLSEVKKLVKLDSEVPKNIDVKPEHDYHDSKMLKEIREHQVKKSASHSRFLSMYGFIPAELLSKAKQGEGSKGGKIIGHTKAGKPIYASEDRKPYPGEEAHSLKMPEGQRKKTYIPPEGTAPHYADTPNLRAYKGLIRYFKQKGMDFQGHITFDPKSNQVETLSDTGKSMIKQIIAEHSEK